MPRSILEESRLHPAIRDTLLWFFLIFLFGTLAYLTWGTASGYLSDPYKLIRKNTDRLTGWVFDLTGSYHAAFINGVAWNLLNLAIAVWLLRRRLNQ